ncbi:hypothetical protein L1987_73911 [Smallanthus sonchifolius]|uniref:Uncharacterized protein n=1 Tax=Smallanthus sonchifolius TaxID=185202 RepID=A0ACB9A0K6_9ASTR|nr:hypothetical protein L1987_73911 [Smallanthus sonchifolius]
MDCNKEEAVRAKQLAEKKMEIKDFSGALKIAVKAQQLYPALENISQLILVCEVHCSAEKKSYGTDKDWYGILKIEPNTDDTAIKKQYRKLALILHPDKNSFPGSTDAFKLIGEAQRVLLDREKRMIHDSKRRAFGNISSPSWIPKQPSRPSNAQHQHPWNQGQPVNLTRGHTSNVQFTPQQVPTGVSGLTSTFWTVCPFCSVRYQFYRDVLNKAIHCHSCKKSFTAFELNARGASAAPTANKTQTRQHQNRVSPKPAKGPNGTFTTKPVFEKKEPPKTQGNVNRKRKKRIEESSESSDSSESSESEEDVEAHSVQKNGDENPANPDFHHFGEEPRRSSRSKRNVSYKENINDVDNAADDDDNDDDATPNPAEGAKKAAFDDEKPQKDKRNSDNKEGESANDDDTEEEIEPEVFECPDPEFSDFDKHRKEESFSVGQIWACYDTEDAMPRFYAIIKKISPGFKLQIQWLKPDPVITNEKKWVDEELPVSCGRYKHEKLDKSQDILSFSHLVTWEAGQKAKTVNIIPRKGDTWAIFKNWSMNWKYDEERKYEYKFVEILSDFDEKAGVRVAYLEKVKGFVCLFRKKEGGETVIAGSEKYRFAHMVPSCRMSGKERDDVPKGSYELDPASLPASTFG